MHRDGHGIPSGALTRILMASLNSSLLKLKPGNDAGARRKAAAPVPLHDCIRILSEIDESARSF